MPASISIAITNSIIREGLRRIFTDASFEVAGSVSTLEELVLTSDDEDEDVQHILVVERDLLQGNSTGIVETMQHDHSDMRIIVLTGSFDFDEMVSLYAAGVYAYFPDNLPYLSLVAILQMVSNGQKVAPPEVIDFLVSLPAATRHAAPAPAIEAFGFRDREVRVLEHLALGQPNKAISREMGINETAVKAAVKAILRKLGVENRTQAAVMARELINRPSSLVGQEAVEGNVDFPQTTHPPQTSRFDPGSTSSDSSTRHFSGGHPIGRPIAPKSRNTLYQ
ncbi:MAG: response regulator transcription factor [Novosphingobium sp.]